MKTLDLIGARLEGDEFISTPVGDIEIIDNYFSDDAPSSRLFARDAHGRRPANGGSGKLQSDPTGAITSSFTFQPADRTDGH